jgi:hypothetical protein
VCVPNTIKYAASGVINTCSVRLCFHLHQSFVCVTYCPSSSIWRGTCWANCQSNQHHDRCHYWYFPLPNIAVCLKTRVNRRQIP